MDHKQHVFASGGQGQPSAGVGVSNGCEREVYGVALRKGGGNAEKLFQRSVFVLCEGKLKLTQVIVALTLDCF